VLYGLVTAELVVLREDGSGELTEVVS